jgi:deazaflavin-dependent oxidoreductase (nitroreductase family)
MTGNAMEALAADKVVDITTTGRKTGEPRKIEIWYHRIDGKYYITGTPGIPRNWYANLVAHPSFTFHLKESATLDLPAIARPITEGAERKQVFAGILANLGELTNTPGNEPEAWLAESPLIEVSFPDATRQPQR